MLSDELWSKLKEIMLQHQIDDKSNFRMMVEAILYRMPVGCSWLDLPIEFGCWNSIDQPLNRWSSKDKWMNFFKDLIQHPELEWELIDGSIVRCHWRGTSSTAKYNVHMLVDDEVFETDVEAARCEKRFKNWSRLWTLNLIENLNPDWRALYENICR